MTAAQADGTLAVVDLGSNSLRLLLCEAIEDGGPRGERHSTVIGLRRGAAADGTLAADALARLDAALGEYATAIARFAPARVVAVATSATRDAPNRQAVEHLIADHLGVAVRIVAGAEEADLAFAGAALAVEGPGPVVVVDVGGGSTELALGAGGTLATAASLQLGAVRQTEAHLHGDPPSRAQLSALRAAVRADLDGVAARFGRGRPRLVAVAGTATTLAAIDLGHYDPARVHGHVLTRDGVEGMVESLAPMAVARRREVPGLDPARAGVIVAGAVILAEVMAALGRPRLMVSERDILDGIAMAAAEGRASFHL